jgi:hypothetical protein
MSRRAHWNHKVIQGAKTTCLDTVNNLISQSLLCQVQYKASDCLPFILVPATLTATSPVAEPVIDIKLYLRRRTWMAIPLLSIYRSEHFESKSLEAASGDKIIISSADRERTFARSPHNAFWYLMTNKDTKLQAWGWRNCIWVTCWKFRVRA